MKRILMAAGFILPLVLLSCRGKSKMEGVVDASKPVDMAALVAAVPNSGPRTGNNYKTFFLVLRQNQQPAAGFKIDAWVKGKSEPVTKITNAQGLVTFEDLPFPEVKQRLNMVLHYYKGQKDQEREIDYPFIESDAYRLKDTQYIPNTATPEPS